MNDALLWNEIGNIYLKMELYDDAISVYLKSLELNPDSGWTYSNLAFSYYRKAEFGRAISLYRISIPLLTDPKKLAITWNRLGDTFRTIKDMENAVIAYKKADNLEIKLSLSSLPANKGRPLTENSSVLTNPPHAPRTTVPPETPHFARLPSQPREPQHASPIINKEPSRNPLAQSGITPVAMPKSAEEKRTNPSAGNQSKPSIIPAYELKRSNLYVIPSPVPEQVEQSDVHPSNPPEQDTQPLDLGASAWHQPIPIQDPIPTQVVQPGINTTKSKDDINLEEILAKINIYENITTTNPTNDRAWDTLGKLYKSLGRYADAIAAYKQAIDKAPEREVYYYYLGLLYSVQQQDEDAAWAFENVLKLNPDYVLAHSALAGIYRRMGQEAKADEHISIALPRMSNESAYNLACFYAICGEVEKAIGYLEQALKNNDTTIEWIKSDPDLELLHNDQRYQELIAASEAAAHQRSKDNYFASDVDGPTNKLLPVLNNSLAR